MQEKLRQILMFAGILGIIALSIAALMYAHSYRRSVDSTLLRSFSVSAEGRVTATPDIAEITFSVITENGALREIQRENTERMNRAIEFIKAQGVDAKDIKTQNYIIQPRYAPCPPSDREKFCPPQRIIGYSVTHTTSVKIRDFQIIGDVLAGIVEQGVNVVSGPALTIEDPTELQSQARKEAIEKAQRQAQVIAEAGGFRVGKLLSINESFYPPMPFAQTHVSRGAVLMEDAALPPPRIEPGTQEITVFINLRYSIK